MNATPRTGDALGRVLLALARDAIAARFGAASRSPAAAPPEMKEMLDTRGATFVTLTQDGRLRGCIGSLEAHRPLRLDVCENAVAAAFRDPRFAPLRAEELQRTRVEVSLLSTPEPLPVEGEDDLLRKLRPGDDGVIFRVGARRATFLPQVWEQLPTAREFMAHLKEKAGFPADYWSDEVSIERYHVRKWKEDAS
jgi:AmmeMemoRadiSam system protein A